jgi:hypothetical protein
MSEAKEIRKLGKIEDIDIYYNHYIEKNHFYLGWKGKVPQESGMIYIPYQDMKNCEGIPLPDVNDDQGEFVTIKVREEIDFMIGSSEDFEDYKKALKLYREQLEQKYFDNNMFNFIQKGI